MLLSLAKIAELTATSYLGNPNTQVTNVSSLQSADEQSICFVLAEKHLKPAQKSLASVLIVKNSFSDRLDRPLLISDNPELTFVQIIKLFNDNTSAAGIHSSAIIDSSVKLDSSLTIHANVVIGKNVSLGKRVYIGAGSIIEQDVLIDDDTIIHPRVTICRQSEIGKNCILHPGAVIGSDGFGLTKLGDEWIKIPQIGRAIIKDNVEIGANTTIDRGALDDTIINNGVKLDNQIQVAHNVEIGENTAIAACVGIAGSAKIGKNCQISGQAVVLGHLTIVDNVIITAMSLVTKSINSAGVYSSGTPLLENKQWHKSNVRYKQLDDLAKAVKALQNNQTKNG